MSEGLAVTMKVLQRTRTISFGPAICQAALDWSLRIPDNRPVGLKDSASLEMNESYGKGKGQLIAWTR